MSDIEQLPESEEPRPVQPTKGIAAVMDRLGISESDLPAPDAIEGEEWIAHSVFERQTDATGRMRYAEPTDCPGMLRIQDDSGTLWPCSCDAPGCGFEVAVHVAKLDPSRLLERRYATAGLPEQFIGKEFDGKDQAQHPTLEVCRQWLRDFRENKLADSIPTVGLWGGTGRGKSHLLSLIVETLIKRGVDAMYRPAAELLDELQAGFDEQTYEARWQRALRVPVLALDDLGAGRRTDWRTDRLEALVDYRYSHSLPLLIATNIPPHRWTEVFGDRPASRLKGMVLPLRLEGPDRREQGVQQSLDQAAA